jgi:hypothetical protein
VTTEFHVEAETPGELALSEALRLWHLDVYDPPRSDRSERSKHSRSVIESILTASGWTWEVPYKGDGQVEWCGLFAGACWRAAGLDSKWLATYFASTYRLDNWARYRPWDAAHPNPRPIDRPRMLAEFTSESTGVPFDPEPGDILMIGDGEPRCGDHICIVERYDEARRVFLTVEGNGTGTGPDGKRRQGIVRAERRLGGSGFCARRLIRPSEWDLVAS